MATFVDEYFELFQSLQPRVDMDQIGAILNESERIAPSQLLIDHSAYFGHAVAGGLDLV